MSRETDSPSSGPQAGGGTAYPSGTEPYGTPTGGATGESAGRAAAQPGEPKTETTLTTRIRINIPGSRPIPPVVVRKPVAEAGGTGEGAGPGGQAPGDRPEGRDAAGGAARTPAGGTPAVAPGGPGGAPGKGRPTSSWFAPRKPVADGPQGAAPDVPRGAVPGTPAAPPRQRTDTPPHGFAAEPPESGGPLGIGGANGFPPPTSVGTPPHGFPAASPPGPSATAPGPFPDDGPGGPTTSATGETLLPPGFQQTHGGPPPAPAHNGTRPGPDTGPQPAVDGASAVPGPPRIGGPTLDLGGPASASASADGERVSGDTLVGSIPRVPPAGGDGRFRDGEDDRGDGGENGTDPARHAGPAAPPPAPAPARRGRSKQVLVGFAAFGLLGVAVAYGAGLLLDHAEVPNGTTVLGVEIGGISREEAVDRLDAALGKRAATPLVLQVEGGEETLKPSVAGLSFDTETTVRQASGQDYNPVSVIGSLLGGARHAEPVFKVDEEKLTAALEDLTRGVTNGGAREGTVEFVDGKAVGKPGEPYQQVDLDKGADLLEKAYREQVATGGKPAVALPVSVRQPEIGQEEIDRAIREFGEPAMSGLATVRAGDRSISFSPTGTLPTFLSMKPVDGKLVDSYDLKVLEKLYGSTFDGVLITRGDGSKTPVTPQDVAGALREALRETGEDKRVGVIELDPQ
ncbi:hypothetical protein V1L54_07300 [Streptomyces sp. TRM 70361]|uniref:hypothetical protein n=1 Tax=Streptomyces sp. TRM 70361 TaxID=3116553 RepID=UPI002E7B9200|nr:hypothetical protein [Streptomyces sp. TRM 70361]MEE1939219.1 hypothetical protein [Streptomyces sp. TRM 70361]